MKITKIKGTLDFYGQEAEKFTYLQNLSAQIAKRFGFKEIITPIFEATEVFTRSVGVTSDIVNKEMYTFIDRGQRSITLKPEGTAPITRAYVENKLYAMPGVGKYYYFGPMFRYERPQAGRLRQFTQFGVEAFGGENALMDADIINLSYQILKAIGIDKVKVLINSIGGEEARCAYIAKLKEHFEPHLSSLCQDCQTRFIHNPLRMLDCKIDANHQAMQTAPKIIDYLAHDDQVYYQNVLKALDCLKIDYVDSPHLVRGLDYYTNTVFEIICDDPQSSLDQVALSAGGRYNGLASAFGGPTTPAIGFAMGIERLMILMDELGLTVPKEDEKSIVIITIGEEQKEYGLMMLQYLRENKLSVEMDYANHHLKPQFKLASRVNADYIIIIGEDEINNDRVRIKDSNTQRESVLAISELNEFLQIKGGVYAYKK